MTEAIFGFVGVIVGALLSGATTMLIERRREGKDAIVAARLVSEEISMIQGEVESWITNRLVPERLVLKHDAWDTHKQILARSLPPPDWEMVCATYTWVHLLTTDPGPGEISEKSIDFYESIKTEVSGGVISLEPLVEEMRIRVPRRIRRLRRQKVREAQRRAYRT